MYQGTAAPQPRLSPASWWLAAVPVGFLAVFFAWPTAALISKGLGGTGGPPLPWHRVWEAAGTTVGLASAGTVLALACGLPACWALFRVRWPGAGIVTALSAVPFVLPTIVVATAFRALTRDWDLLRSDAGTTLTIVAALAFFNVSVVLRVVGPVVARLDRRRYWAARTLGASPLRATMTAHLPALRHAIAAAAATVWLFCAASFGIVIVLGGGRVTTIDAEIYLQANQFLNLRAAAALSILQIVAVGAALGVAALIRSRSGDLTEVQEPSPARVTSLSMAIGVAAALVPSGVLMMAPMLALVFRSLHGPRGWTFTYYTNLASGNHLPGMMDSVPSASLRSLTTAALVAVVATVLGFCVALVAARRRRGALLLSLAVLPLGVSSVVVGLGSLVTLARDLPGGLNLAQAGVLVPAAHLVVALPLATMTITPALRAVPPSLLAAAATLGASPLRVLVSVEWPLVRRSVAMAMGLCGAVSLGEFGATALLARPGSATLPSLIFHLLGRPGPESLGTAFAACVVLGALTAALALLADRRPQKGAA